MKDKLIGLVILLMICIGIVFDAIGEAEVSGLSFVSLSSFVFVAGFGGGLTYMSKNKYKGNELVSILKNNLIRGGWMGFLAGMIIVLSGGIDSVYFGPGVSAAAVTILYGYIGGYLAEALLEK
tara:strand:- start:1500 stop:1868 length:369 start_codon:yes stop_codon:yes gene_type:complete